MINTYRNEIETASRHELIELIENHSMDTIEDYLTMDVDDLREAVIEYLEEQFDWIETVEADILDSIANGNWIEGVKQMERHYISIYNLIDWIEEYNELCGYSAYSWFDMTSAVSLEQTLQSERARVA